LPHFRLLARTGHAWAPTGFICPHSRSSDPTVWVAPQVVCTLPQNFTVHPLWLHAWNTRLTSVIPKRINCNRQISIFNASLLALNDMMGWHHVIPSCHLITGQSFWISFLVKFWIFLSAINNSDTLIKSFKLKKFFFIRDSY